MWEGARQDLGLQVLGHWLPRVSADGHQHVAGRVLVRLFQLLREWGRRAVSTGSHGPAIWHAWSAFAGRAAGDNPFAGQKTEAEESAYAAGDKVTSSDSL